MVGEFKSGKIRPQMMLDDSKDKVIESLNPTLKTGKKWKVRDTIKSDKANLAFEEIIGWRQGLRMREKHRWSKTTDKNRRDMVIENVRSKVDNK